MRTKFSPVGYLCFSFGLALSSVSAQSYNPLTNYPVSDFQRGATNLLPHSTARISGSPSGVNTLINGIITEGDQRDIAVIRNPNQTISLTTVRNDSVRLQNGLLLQGSNLSQINFHSIADNGTVIGNGQDLSTGAYLPVIKTTQELEPRQLTLDSGTAPVVSSGSANSINAAGTRITGQQQYGDLCLGAPGILQFNSAVIWNDAGQIVSRLGTHPTFDLGSFCGNPHRYQRTRAMAVSESGNMVAVAAQTDLSSTAQDRLVVFNISNLNNPIIVADINTTQMGLPMYSTILSARVRDQGELVISIFSSGTHREYVRLLNGSIIQLPDVLNTSGCSLADFIKRSGNIIVSRSCTSLNNYFDGTADLRAVNANTGAITQIDLARFGPFPYQASDPTAILVKGRAIYDSQASEAAIRN